MDLNGELDLKEYPWQNSQHKTIVGRFIDLNDQNIVLSIGGGAREVSVPLNSLSKRFTSISKKIKVQSFCS